MPLLSKFLLPLAFGQLAAAVWPLPSNYTAGTTALFISSDVKIELSSSKTNVGMMELFEQDYILHTDNTAVSQIVIAAIKTAQKTIFSQGYIPWKFHSRNADFEPEQQACEQIQKITLVQTAQDSDSAMKPLAGEVDESYELELTKDGTVTITAATPLGISYGLTTFTQLFYKHSDGSVYTPYAPVSISDKPAFPHRGLNMDLARAWFTPADVRRQIDALAYSKMNRLHLHITDAQSWPLVIESMPELSDKGAYRKDLVYSKDVLDQLQLYGAQRGVEVYLEIDMPGHTSSLWYSHPELIASFNLQPDWNNYAAEPPSGTLKLNEPKVYAFLQKLFDDLLPRVLPYNAYFHTGGDEVNPNAYLNDDTVKSNDSAVIKPLMQKFIDNNHKIVRAAGLTPIVWEEMLLQWNLTLGDDVIVQTWQSDDAVKQTVEKGHKVLVGNYNYWYLDCGQGQWLNFNNTAQYYPFNDYCNPRKNWRLVYSYDPFTGVSASNQHLVLGGEVHAWAEQIDPVNIDRQVWPRAAAAAEVLWSGKPNARPQADAAMALSDLRERLVMMGVGAEPIQMPFCTMEADEDQVTGGKKKNGAAKLQVDGGKIVGLLLVVVGLFVLV